MGGEEQILHKLLGDRRGTAEAGSLTRTVGRYQVAQIIINARSRRIQRERERAALAENREDR
jgi:hypothetical protein